MNENETENTEQLPEPDTPSLNMVGVIQDGKFIPYGMTGIRGGIPVYVFNTYEDYEAAAPTLPETCMIVTLEDLETGGFEFDSELSETSENAPQTKVVAAALKKKASFDSPGVVQFSGSESVTDRESGLALSAIEKNSLVEGTLANLIKKVESSLSNKKPEYYEKETVGGVSLEVPYASVYILAARTYLAANANTRTVKLFFLEAWAAEANISEISVLNGPGASKCEVSARITGEKIAITVSTENSNYRARIAAIRFF